MVSEGRHQRLRGVSGAGSRVEEKSELADSEQNFSGKRLMVSAKLSALLLNLEAPLLPEIQIKCAVSRKPSWTCPALTWAHAQTAPTVCWPHLSAVGAEKQQGRPGETLEE